MNLRKNLALMGASLFVTLTLHASSPILITIDETDPSNVIFTATCASPANSDVSHYFGDGIDLTNFFSSPVSLDTSILSSSFSTSVDGTPFFDSAVADNFNGSYVDFNPYNLEDYDNGYDSEPQAPGFITETFDTGSSAFQGTFTIDLSSVEAFLPDLGTEGCLYAGYSGDTATPVFLGSWEVTAGGPVPEPGEWGFVVFLGTVVLLGARKVRPAMPTQRI